MSEQEEKKVREPRTQILITDIPKKQFDSKWPETLEKELFEGEFAGLKQKLQYYTPLAFLNRIVIIFDDEPAAKNVYAHLKHRLQNLPYKIYLAESLLVKPRAKSVDDLNESDGAGANARVDGKPVLSINTDPSNTGIKSSSLSLGSPSLSPERNPLESPTLLKFDRQSKAHYYKEPLPRFHRASSQSSLSSSTDMVTYLYKPEPSLATVTSSSDAASSTDSELRIPPPSPSITLNEFTH